MRFLCRDVDNDAPDDAHEIIASYADEAAEEYAQYCHSHRDYWEHSWPVRFGVRLSPDQIDSVDEDAIEDAGFGIEQIFEVVRDMEPVFHAAIERFDHPRKPVRCMDCGNRAPWDPWTGWGWCRCKHPDAATKLTAAGVRPG